VISVVIPAYNEAQVIERALKAITRGSRVEELQIVLVCNGCTDDTADIARSFGAPVFVVETPIRNKANALNIGDEAATGFPRFYIDADVVVTFDTIKVLSKSLERPEIFAVAPRPRYNLEGCAWVVRAFYDVRRRLPSFDEGIGGSCVYALSKAGRSRFASFPTLVADDTFVRVQFMNFERETVHGATSIVFPPRTIRGLITIEARADFGSLELARRYPLLWKNRGEGNHRQLLFLFRRPALWPRLLAYVLIKIAARSKARTRWRKKAFVWERDETSRATQTTHAAK
jgi:glycosyltransferase involved in cell wall biosynthesis